MVDILIRRLERAAQDAEARGRKELAAILRRDAEGYRQAARSKAKARQEESA